MRLIAALTLALIARPASAWENRQVFMLGGAAIQSALLGALIVQAVRKRPKNFVPSEESSAKDPAKPYEFKDMSLDAK